MLDNAAVSRALAGFTPEDVQLTAAAALLAIAIAGVVLLRARFPGRLIQRSSRLAPRRTAPSRAGAWGRCHWRPRGDLNDKDLKGWSCTSCGKVRWTSSRSEPPAGCR